MTETTATRPSGRNLLEELDSRIPTTFYWYLATLACVGGFLFGYDTSNIGSALPFIPYHLSSFATGYLVAGASLGAAAGALIAGPLTDRFGRKSLLITDAGIYAIGALLSAFTINAGMLLASRTLIGLAIGADSAIATAYIAEFAPRSLARPAEHHPAVDDHGRDPRLLPRGPARAQGEPGRRRQLRLAADPRPWSGPGDPRRRAAVPDAGIAALADAARALRRHQQGVRPAGDEGVRRRSAAGGRRAGPAAGRAAPQDPVDRGRPPGPDHRLRVLHLPADHRHQRAVLLRPAGAVDVLRQRQQRRPGRRGRRRGHRDPRRGQRDRDLLRVPLYRPARLGRWPSEATSAWRCSCCSPRAPWPG